MRMVLTALAVVSMAGGLVSCAEKSSGEKPVPEARGSQTSTQIFSVKGVVKELKPDGRTIVIKHEEIPNYMAAMTMPFEARITNELAGLKPGDEVSFRLLVTDQEGWIDQITKTGATNVVEPPPRETFRRVRFVDPLNIGDAMPDYPFTNELGQAIHLGQFKGQALGLTFIYTRCPLPLEFCDRRADRHRRDHRAVRPDVPARRGHLQPQPAHRGGGRARPRAKGFHRQ